MHGVVYRFGPFDLEADRRRLRRGATLVTPPSRAVDVLLLLAARPGQIIPTESFIDAAWGGTAVTTNSLGQAIKSLRRA
jgi:DNA-binding winged helix-turn-helix (wHTH) protein